MEAHTYSGDGDYVKGEKRGRTRVVGKDRGGGGGI
jgi:hypothetical protein